MTKIIAEVGVNHNGKLSLAKKLIDKAKFAGVDIVKFQSFIPENVVTSNLKLAPYQKKNLTKNIGLGHKKNMYKLYILVFHIYFFLNLEISMKLMSLQY